MLKTFAVLWPVLPHPLPGVETFMRKLFGILLLACASLSWAQSRVEDGGHEIQIWTGGGHTVPGGTSGHRSVECRVTLWMDPYPAARPGFLEGRFEYALDAVPAFVVFQPANTAYGAGFNPLNLKWNFATRGRVVPYLELSGGTLFTNNDVPTGTDRVNFTSSAALGAHILGESRNWSVELGICIFPMPGFPIPILGSTRCRCEWALGSSSGTAEQKKINSRESMLNRTIALSIAVAFFSLGASAKSRQPAGSPPATSTPTSYWR